MNLAEAEAKARTLMSVHAPGYRFAWSNARTQAGVCDYNAREIRLSRPITRMADEAEVIETILHECGHAIAGHRAGHGAVWAAAVRRIGGKPQRTAQMANGREDAPWRGVCPKGHEVGRWFRKPRAVRSCGICAPGVFDARYVLTIRRVDSLVGMR